MRTATSSCRSGSTPERPHPPGWGARRLDLLDVRCWARASLELPEGVTLVSGPNGAGKTSLLEALAIGLVGVSPRTSRDAEIVRAGAEALFVRLDVDAPGGRQSREIGYGPGLGRRLRVDGRRLRSVRDFRAHGSVLAFLPDEIRIVKGPPAARRRHLDRLLEGAVPGYPQTSAAYSEAVSQRNALLRRIRAGDASESELSVWDRQVASRGAAVVAARRQALLELADPFARHLEQLGGGPGGGLRLEPSPAGLVDVGDDEVAAALERRLAQTRTRDVAAAQTLSGPHRDDVSVTASGLDLRQLGSQGEQRTAALALVLAHRDHLTRAAARPVLLLDDALSELDADRRGRLIEAIDDRGQTIVTSADPETASLAPDRIARHLRVLDGRIDGA